MDKVKPAVCWIDKVTVCDNKCAAHRSNNSHSDCTLLNIGITVARAVDKAVSQNGTIYIDMTRHG